MMNKQTPLRTTRSSIYDIPTNILSAIVYLLPAAFAWIPVVGYFAWIIPMAVFLIERKSNFVRFCAAQSFCIGLMRLVFDVVFDSIRNVALRTATLYGLSPDYINLWGSVQGSGQTALVFGNIFAIALCAVCVAAAVMAYFRKLWRMPLLGKVSEFMTTELNPKPRHRTTY